MRLKVDVIVTYGGAVGGRQLPHPSSLQSPSIPLAVASSQISMVSAKFHCTHSMRLYRVYVESEMVNRGKN